MKIQETRIGGLYIVTYDENLRFGSGVGHKTWRAARAFAPIEETMIADVPIPRGSVVMIVSKYDTSGGNCYFTFILDEQVLMASDPSGHMEFTEVTNETF